MADDTICRQAAIDALRRAEALTRAFGYHNVIETIMELPSAQRTGRWIPVAGRMGKEVQCDCCGEVFWYWLTNFTYCPNCGADMRGEQDG